MGNLSVYDPDILHLPVQKFQCSVAAGSPFKVSIEKTKRCVFIHCTQTLKSSSSEQRPQDPNTNTRYASERLRVRVNTCHFGGEKIILDKNNH